MCPPSLLAALTSVCIAAAPVPTSGAAPPLVAEPGAPDAEAPGEDQEARRLFAARDFAAAAAAFEALFERSPVPKYLYNAAQTRELAGHDGHAYLLLRRYLTLPDLGGDDQDRALDRLTALKRRTTALELVLPSVAHVQVSLRRKPTGVPADHGRTPISLTSETLALTRHPQKAGMHLLQLERGPWELVVSAQGFHDWSREISVAEELVSLQVELARLPLPPPVVSASFGPPEALAQGVEVALSPEGEAPRIILIRTPATTWELVRGHYKAIVRARGYLPREVGFTVDESPVTLAVDLEREPPTAGSRPRRDPWALGLSIGAGTTAALGLFLLALGRVQYKLSLDRYSEFVGRDPERWFVAGQNVIQSWMIYGAGGGLIGGGLGLGLGAVGTHCEAKFDRPSRVWGAALGVGAGLAIAGGLLEGRAGFGLQGVLDDHSARFAGLDSSATNSLIGTHHRVAASGVLLGFGAGLALSGLLGLVRQRVASVMVVPSATGISLSGRF